MLQAMKKIVAMSAARTPSDLIPMVLTTPVRGGIQSPKILISKSKDQ